MNTFDKLAAYLHGAFSRTDEVLTAFLTAYSAELDIASGAVGDAVDQMSVSSADGEWLDYWGGYFNVPRPLGETDDAYRARIIVEVLRPRQNNEAIEIAVNGAFGLDAKVVDADAKMYDPIIYNGVATYNGAHLHGDDGGPRYGLFDVLLGEYDLENGEDVAEYIKPLKALVERFRAAGTQLRSMEVTGSLEDVAMTGYDYIGCAVVQKTYYDGTYTYDGTIDYHGEKNGTWDTF